MYSDIKKICLFFVIESYIVLTANHQGLEDLENECIEIY